MLKKNALQHKLQGSIYIDGQENDLINYSPEDFRSSDKEVI